VFTFYDTLRHIAASFNIFLRPLMEITKEIGVCQPSPENCVGYEQARNMLSTVLCLKLTGNDYFRSFTKAQTYIQSSKNNSDKFKQIYGILEIIHPRLKISKDGTHEVIELPTYNDVSDDSICMFITRYKSCLLYEQLSMEQISYNKREQTMFILHALKIDNIFKDGLTYIEAIIQAYQRESQVSSRRTISFRLGNR